MNTAPQIPTLQEEINRKAFQTLDWLHTAHDGGKLSTDQFSAGVDALFMACSGLVDEELIDMITASDAIAKAEERLPRRQIVEKSSKMVVVTWRPGSDTVRIVAYEGGSRTKEDERHYDSVAQAKDAYQRACTTLLKNGYIEP